MTTQEIKTLRELALKLFLDEDIVQELLFEVIRQNLTFPLAVNYLKLTARGSAYKLNTKRTGRRTIDALNHASISIYSTPQEAEECTIADILPEVSEDAILNIDFDLFLKTLNPQEARILNLLLEGYTVREICKHLKISSKTYCKIFNSIRQKALGIFT
jgi:RNA polymerase sigma factor (sigma-70 family)